jgi:hypothetical protein
MENDPIGTAAVNWTDQNGNFHIRVYSTDGYTVTERCADTGSSGWTNGAFSQPGSAVSATAWVDSAGAHIRVYCTSDDGTTEWCSDPNSNWTKGAYTVE